MSSLDQSNLARVNREIVDLQRKIAEESKRESDHTRKSIQAQSQATRASSVSSAKMYLSNAERAAKDAQRSQERRAEYSARLARKTEELSKVQERILRADMEDRRKQAASDLKRQREAERRIQELETQLAERISIDVPIGRLVAEGEENTYDVFISHASEDKEDFVAPLAQHAREKGLLVWYDEFSLSWGDKLRRKIERGLSGSYFGVVVLSEHFFRKEWPQIELDALLQKEVAGTGRILPIWHKITQDDILRYAPTLAGTLALRTADLTIEEIAERLAEVVAKVKRERLELETLS